MGAPEVISVTNSSPLSAPPMDAIGASTASPTRISGSDGTLGCGRPGGEGQPLAARIAALASARFAQRCIEFLDREIDIGF